MRSSDRRRRRYSPRGTGREADESKGGRSGGRPSRLARGVRTRLAASPRHTVAPEGGALRTNRWTRNIAGVTASRGRVNVVADATLSPAAARAYARRILAAADDAERQSPRAT